MSNNLPQQPSAQKLQSSLDTTAMRQAVLQQIEKDLDFEIANIDCKASDFFNNVLEILNSYFINIIDNQSNRLAQIIYRVDINEAKLKRILADPNSSSSAAVIASMALERIMLKVFYRNVYNGTIKR